MVSAKSFSCSARASAASASPLAVSASSLSATACWRACSSCLCELPLRIGQGVGLLASGLLGSGATLLKEGAALLVESIASEANGEQESSSKHRGDLTSAAKFAALALSFRLDGSIAGFAAFVEKCNCRIETRPVTISPTLRWADASAANRALARVRGRSSARRRPWHEAWRSERGAGIAMPSRLRPPPSPSGGSTHASGFRERCR